MAKTSTTTSAQEILSILAVVAWLLVGLWTMIVKIDPDLLKDDVLQPRDGFCYWRNLKENPSIDPDCEALLPQ